MTTAYEASIPDQHIRVIAETLGFMLNKELGLSFTVGQLKEMAERIDRSLAEGRMKEARGG